MQIIYHRLFFNLDYGYIIRHCITLVWWKFLLLFGSNIRFSSILARHCSIFNFICVRWGGSSPKITEISKVLRFYCKTIRLRKIHFFMTWSPKRVIARRWLTQFTTSKCLHLWCFIWSFSNELIVIHNNKRYSLWSCLIIISTNLLRGRWSRCFRKIIHL
jgi:hypothetical protein